MSEITYEMQGEYLLPNIAMPEQPEVTLGRYGQMRRKYLKEHRRILYCNLLTSCKLNEHLMEVEETAMKMETNLMEQMAKNEGLTEELKKSNMIEWVQKMSNLRLTVQEIVMKEVVFA